VHGTPLLALVLSSAKGTNQHLRSNKVTNVEDEHSEAALKDEIIDLPGLGYDPGFRQFSGYLPLPNSTKQIFYWYVESIRSPKDDPVVYWTNGGPGCSGLYGFGTEMGPYNFDAEGNLSQNPWAWNNIVNMLYVEQPAGVGFSYSENEDDYKTGDKQAAEDAYDLVVAFFERYPERKSNEFYISSESYGGHYMPQLALTILNKDIEKNINFKGFLVGNPFVEPISNYIAMYETYYHHGLVKKSLHDKWKAKGCNTMPSRHDNIVICLDLELFMYAGAGPNINPYAVDYPICVDEKYEQENLSRHKMFSKRGRNSLWSHQGAELIGIMNPKLKAHIDTYEPCEEDYFTDYLNREDVQKAIHADARDSEWRVCSYALNWSLKERQTKQMDLYTELVTGGYGLKMLVFSGDDDSICALSGTQQWIYNIGVSVNSNYEWAVWNVDGQTAGYITEFELDEESGTFYLATLHGAGHESPAYKPKEAYDMFERYLTGNWDIRPSRGSKEDSSTIPKSDISVGIEEMSTSAL